MDFDNFWCKMKLRSCLFCFCVLFPTFVCWKIPKNSDQVENPPENLTSFTFFPTWRSSRESIPPPISASKIYKYVNIQFPPPWKFFSYVSSWRPPSFSSIGALQSVNLRSKKIPVMIEEWDRLRKLYSENFVWCFFKGPTVPAGTRDGLL